MIRVLVADDHPVIREGLRRILDGEKGVSVVKEVSSGAEAVEEARTRRCDVIVLDIAMPGMDGIQTLKQLEHERLGIPVLVLSVYAEKQYAVRALQAGAKGYLTKEAAPAELARAVRTLASGRKYIGAVLAEQLADLLDVGATRRPHELLSDREFAVLRLIASGRAPAEMARQLNLAVSTVSTYRARIIKKMNFATNAELVRYALENHLID